MPNHLPTVRVPRVRCGEVKRPPEPVSQADADPFEFCGDVEVWRSVPAFPNYEASNFGGVRNVSTGRRLGACANKNGHLHLKLYQGGQRRHFFLHRVVAITFIGEQPSDEHRVCHNDGDKKRNHVLNLRWGTHQDNADDAVRHRLPWQPGGPTGKHSVELVIAIKALLATKLSQHTIARLLHVGRSTVGNISRGYYWRHVQPAQVQE